ncbi:hemerythrin domain-containing protein [Limnobacter parvus]|uniref:Hemerythrin domain-containing protein n=1 Tax=Limnobacter parvus TaxID=2939690 RepID=A0ABT1XMS1_9BURK|nr:hemerythrin domain-containing protein [Limnobacter parvus]MCR2747843.1 hemerythrin domain-containing protein [Limnobacter parvus]
MTDTRNTEIFDTTETEMDAVSMLKADHEKVNALFEEYEKAESDEEKKELVAEICAELSVHAQLEEEIFYPAFKAAHEDKMLVPEATVEHATMMSLIEQIEGIEPDGEDYDAKVKVLSEYVKHHVKEEQSEMFTKAKTDSLDLDELGALMAERKIDLLAERD